jgi:hypothetical protein
MTLVLSPLSLTKVFLRSTETWSCCDELQYKIYCDKHFAFQGCEFCDFDLSAESCECE